MLACSTESNNLPLSTPLGESVADTTIMNGSRRKDASVLLQFVEVNMFSNYKPINNSDRFAIRWFFFTVVIP